MPAKKPKEEPDIVEDVAPAAGLKAAPRLSAVPTAKPDAKASALNDDAPDWRGTCAICFDLLPVELKRQAFYECCCKKICAECHFKCRQHDDRCPLCRALAWKSPAEWVRRVQEHVDNGNAEAQIMLGNEYKTGGMGLKKSFKRSVRMYELAAAQGNVRGQVKLGCSYESGDGVKIDYKAAAQWYRRAVEQGYPAAQFNLGLLFANGNGVAQSYDEAVKWWRLAAAQGHAEALYSLGVCYAKGRGVPQDLHEALRLFRRAAAKGCAGAAAAEKLAVQLAARSGRPT